jgi:hypothetical protein
MATHNLVDNSIDQTPKHLTIKTMNPKTFLSLSVLLAAGILLGSFIFKNPNIVNAIVSNQPAYTASTEASSTCANGTSTLLLAALQLNGGVQRNSFDVTNASGTAIYLCKSTTCLVGTGKYLASLGGQFTQEDNYVGAYSCIASGSTTGTVSFSYSQTGQ